QVITLDGANRNPNSAAMKIGVLSSIIYPGGGSTSLDYEPNQYFDTRTNESLLGGGLRIASIVYFDGISSASVIEKHFNYKNVATNSSGRLLSKPMFAMPSFKWKNPNKYNSTSTTDDKTYVTLTGDNIWKFLTIRTDFDLSSSETTHGSTVGYQVVTVNRTG